MTTQQCTRLLFCTTCKNDTTHTFVGGSNNPKTGDRVPVFRCPVCRVEAQYVNEKMPDVKEYKES